MVGNRRAISTSRRRNVQIYLQDGKRPQRALITPCPNARPKEADPLYQTAHSRICRPRARRIDAQGVVPGPSPEVYAFYRGTTQRNLYRIPVP